MPLFTDLDIAAWEIMFDAIYINEYYSWDDIAL